jgi:hypothetical protein
MLSEHDVFYGLLRSHALHIQPIRAQGRDTYVNNTCRVVYTPSSIRTTRCDVASYCIEFHAIL